MIAGILAAVAMPRVLDTADVDQAGAVDEVRAALQHARKMAVYSRRYVCVTVSGNQLTLMRNPSAPENVSAQCDASAVLPLDLPAPKDTSAKNAIILPSTVTLSMTPGSFYFFPGTGSASTAAVLNVSGRTLTLNTTTGIVQ